MQLQQRAHVCDGDNKQFSATIPGRNLCTREGIILVIQCAMAVVFFTEQRHALLLA